MAELRELRYLVAVAEEGQIVRAAARLHIAQPALSQAIRKLERAYGVPLLERHARGVRLTAEGAQMVAKARAILAEASEMDAMAHGWVDTDVQQLEIGVQAVSLTMLEPLLQTLARQEPDVQVSLRQLDFTTQRVALRRGQVDAEIACPAPTTGEFAVVALAEVGRTAWVSATHPLAGRSQLTLADVGELPVWGRHPDVPADWWNSLFADIRHPEAPNTVGTPRTPDEAWPLVVSGQAISISPEYVGRGHFPGVVGIPIKDSTPILVALLHREGDRRASLRSLTRAARQIAPSAGRAGRSRGN